MSGRRRRDDGWDDGHQEAQDDRRDPWADNSVEEWGDRDPDQGHDTDWSESVVDAAWAKASVDGQGTGGYPARAGAGAYVTNDAAAKGYSPAPPAFPSFQAPGGNGRGSSAGGQASGYGAARNGDRYGAGPGYGGQRGAANGYGAAGYNGNGYQDSGYGRANNGGSRRDAAGYNDAGPGGPRNGSAGGRNGYGYDANGRPAGPAYAPEFTPADNADIDDDGPAGTPRPYGRLSIYTLHEDKAREFDRLAERAAEGVRAAEPDTLVYVIHVVPKAPMQRIIYEIYRDRAAFLTHERQPHIRQFAAERAPCVLATNIIDLRLKYAKVAALGSAAEFPMPPQANRAPRAPESAAGGDRYPAAGAQQPTAQQPTAQHQATQYSAAQYPRTQSQQPGAASFTPAKERYADTGQPTVGREAYPPAAQYGSNGTGGYGAANGQYGAANAYSGAAGYANGGSYSGANSYQNPNGYPAPNGYGAEAAGAGGYWAANGYQSANGQADASANGYANGNGNGYSPANGGYANGGSYSGASEYANGNGYPTASGYPNGGSYQNGNGYGAAGGPPGNGATAQGPQYTPRYRELTSASPDGSESGYPDNGAGYSDGRQSYRPQSAEWAPRSQDQR
jgi:quinol monooxygenase YgiN